MMHARRRVARVRLRRLILAEQALMMDDKAAPVQHITYNSNKYAHFNNSDEEFDDRKQPPADHHPLNSLPPQAPPPQASRQEQP